MVEEGGGSGGKKWKFKSKERRLSAHSLSSLSSILFLLIRPFFLSIAQACFFSQHQKQSASENYANFTHQFYAWLETILSFKWPICYHYLELLWVKWLSGCILAWPWTMRHPKSFGVSNFKGQPRVWPKIWMCTKFGVSIDRLLTKMLKDDRLSNWWPHTMASGGCLMASGNTVYTLINGP